MQISDELIAYLEDLSRLSLTDDEKTRLKGDLAQIIGHMALINELDTENVPETGHLPRVNVFREDEARPSLDRELILQNAPRRTEEMFVAPGVWGGSV